MEKERCYRCDYCKELYLNRDDALECCAEISEVLAYVCPECNQPWERKEDAVACCGGDA